MKRTHSFRTLRQWLFAGTLALGTYFAGAAWDTAALAQIIPGEADHLKCYQVLRDQNPFAEREVDLVNKFGLEPGCHVVTKARLFCTAARKFIDGGNGDDPRGEALETDFTCYNVECPPNPRKRITIDDQFGNRDIGIKDARMLCTPTRSHPAN